MSDTEVTEVTQAKEDEFVPMDVLKRLGSMQDKAAFSALQAENDQLKLKVFQMEIRAAFSITDDDRIDPATGKITRV